MNNIRKRNLIIVTLFLIINIFALFLAWIIYFSIKNNSSNTLYYQIYQDDFSKKTNSYLYLMNGTNKNYLFSNFANGDVLYDFEQINGYNFFHPYYFNDQIGFTWFFKQGDNIYFYKIDNIHDFNDFQNNTLDYIGSFYELNDSVNHEYLYIPEYDYIFAINNVNGSSGIYNDDNGGLGDPSIQEIVFINCNTGGVEFMNISNLLNYESNSWYYIDNNNNYYRTIMPSNDLFHFNSIDFDGENIYANSRTLGAIISIKVFDEMGNFMQNPQVNWIYSDNYATYYYSYTEDLEGDHPIIYSDNLNHYIENSNYDAQEIYNFKKNNEGLQNKFINWEIGGVYYDVDNLEDLKNAQKENEEELFMGEHCVKLLNSYIEKLGPELFFEDPNYYDSNNLYFSMFDNHAEYTATNLEIHEDSEDNYPLFEDDLNSYIKIIEINPTNKTSKNGLFPMTGRTILNYPVEQKSEIVSSCYFFNENNMNYVAIDQGFRDPEDQNENKARISIYQFDKIDPKTKNFTSVKLVYDAHFITNYVYRSYPVWITLDNVISSWSYS